MIFAMAKTVLSDSLPCKRRTREDERCYRPSRVAAAYCHSYDPEKAPNQDEARRIRIKKTGCDKTLVCIGSGDY